MGAPNRHFPPKLPPRDRFGWVVAVRWRLHSLWLTLGRPRGTPTRTLYGFLYGGHEIPYLESPPDSVRAKVVGLGRKGPMRIPISRGSNLARALPVPFALSGPSDQIAVAA